MNRPRYKIVPLTLAHANKLVTALHRHHKKTTTHRFSIGVVDEKGVVRGAAIVGRPVARLTDQYAIAEVSRLVTDGTPNACSALYGAAARIAREMGFRKIQTFVLESEPGTSLRASGWTMEGTTKGGDWDGPARRAARPSGQPTRPKQRWTKVFTQD